MIRRIPATDPARAGAAVNFDANFIFLQLRKSKREGLLELFWGEQPPFALLRSAEGGTFLPLVVIKTESRNYRAAGNRAQPGAQCCRLKPESRRRTRH